MFTDTLLDLFMTNIAPGLYIAAVFLWGLFYVAWKTGKVKITFTARKPKPGVAEKRSDHREAWYQR